MTLNINYSAKINERLVGFAISAEPHIIGIVGTATYAPGFIRLVEVPEGPFPAVTIPGYTEIASGTPTGTQFVVDYVTGVVTFATAQDGNSISVSYTGLGSEFAAEDVNELQNPLGTIASQSIIYNWPLAPTVSWALAPLNQALNANSHQINNLTDPTLAQDAATKHYVDAHSSSPAGSNTQIQYNNGGAFGASPNLTFVGGSILIVGVTPNIEISAPGPNTLIASNGFSGISIEPATTLTVLSNGVATYYFSSGIGSAPQLGIGTSTPAASAAVDITSTTSGFLEPRMTTTQRNAISSPAEGLQVYDLTLHQFYGWNGSSWVLLG